MTVTRAGRLRFQIRIQRAGATQDTFGAPVSVPWTTIVTRYAEVLADTGREVIAARQRLAEVSHVLRLRAIPALDLVPTGTPDRVLPKDRVLLADGRILDILAILPENGRPAAVQLLCQELVA